MDKKRYTAKEMREAASTCETVEVADQFYSVEMDRAAAMLRQAAETEERLQKEYKAIMKNIEEWPNHGDETVFAHQLPWMLERIFGVEAP